MGEITIKETVPTTVAFMRASWPYGSIPEALGRLYAWARGRGHTPDGMPTTVFLTDPRTTPETEAVWEVWAPFSRMREWVADRGWEVVGPPRESYFSDPEETAPGETLTEVQFPVRTV